MKIACLGNMNNIMFQIGRYLLDEKHDVTFFLFDEFDHFLPNADTYEDISKYNIINLGWNHEQYFKLTKHEIKEIVKGFDFYIGTDLSPAYLFKAGMRLDIFFPHGNDLYDYAFPKYRNMPPSVMEIIPYIVGKAQFKGIRESTVISLDPSDDVYEIPTEKIRTKYKRRISALPFLYLKQYKNGFKKKSGILEKLVEIRNKNKFIVFQHSSQDWSSRGPYKINKGNNILITAFSEYLKEGNYISDSLLVLVEYGTDLDKSKKLITELNIESNVVWLPKMNRKDIMIAISLSDICVGELGPRHWLSYSCIFEFMAMKKPLIHHRNDAHYKDLDLYPMNDASDINTVKNGLTKYRLDPEKYIEMGLRAFEWLNSRTNKSVNEVLEISKEKIENKLPKNDFENPRFTELQILFKLSNYV